MSDPSTSPGLRVLASNASGRCEPGSDTCAVPGTESPVSAEGTPPGPGPDGIDENARVGERSDAD